MFKIKDYPQLSFRPENKNDEAFLFNLYASSRAWEMAQVDWSASEKLAFLSMQFNAQRKHYAAHYGDSDFLIILEADTPVGRLYLQDRGEEIRIVDITLIPEKRGGGIGTVILKDLQEQAGAAGKKLGIHVEQYNPAKALYERLGFLKKEDKGVYLFMLWEGEKV